MFKAESGNSRRVSDLKKFALQQTSRKVEGLQGLNDSAQAVAYKAGQCAQERDERLLLFCAEVSRTNFRIKIRIPPAAVGVEIHDIVKSGEATVVHVRWRAVTST